MAEPVVSGESLIVCRLVIRRYLINGRSGSEWNRAGSKSPAEGRRCDRLHYARPWLSACKYPQIHLQIHLDTFKGLKDGRFDFGDWEGQLWAFPSNGSSPVPVQGAPVEFSDVVAGIAA